MIIPQQTADIADDGIGTLILEQALIDRNHFVCALFINAGYDLSLIHIYSDRPSSAPLSKSG